VSSHCVFTALLNPFDRLFYRIGVVQGLVEYHEEDEEGSQSEGSQGQQEGEEQSELSISEEGA
jgi:hypothetical protein